MDYWKKIILKYISNKHDNKFDEVMYYCVVLLLLVGTALIVFMDYILSSTWDSIDRLKFELWISQFMVLLCILYLINLFRQSDTYKKLPVVELFLIFVEKFLEDMEWWNAKVENYERLHISVSYTYFTIWVVYQMWLYYSIVVVIDTLIWPLYYYVEFYLNIACLTLYFLGIYVYSWDDFIVFLHILFFWKPLFSNSVYQSFKFLFIIQVKIFPIWIIEKKLD